MSREEDADFGQSLRTIASWGEPDRTPAPSELARILPECTPGVDERSRWRWWLAAAATVVVIAGTAAAVTINRSHEVGVADSIPVSPDTSFPVVSSSTTVDPFGQAALEADGRVLAAIEADPAGAEALAARLAESLEKGECVPASSVDLGLLSGAASWDRVCRYGPASGDPTGVSLIGVDHIPNITFSATYPIEPSTCYRNLTGTWWSWYSGSGDAMKPCVDGYTFQGA